MDRTVTPDSASRTTGATSERTQHHTGESGPAARSAHRVADELLDVWMQEHEALLLHQVERVTRDHHMAQDIVQETFVRAWTSAESLHRGNGSLRGWLSTVARNLAIDRIRRLSNQREITCAEAPEHVAPHGDHAERIVGEDHVHRLLAPLSPIQREVLYWTFVEGHSTDEVATRLQVPPGTVKSRRHYALKSLRQALDDADGRGLAA